MQPAIAAFLYGYVLFAPLAFIVMLLNPGGDLRSALSDAVVVGSLIALVKLAQAAFYASKAEAPRPKLWHLTITVGILMVAGTVAAMVAVAASRLQLRPLPPFAVTVGCVFFIAVSAFVGRLLDRPHPRSDQA